MTHWSWYTWPLIAIQGVIFFYFISLNGMYLLLLCLSVVWCRRYKRQAAVHPIDFDVLDNLKRLVPPITIIVPAYNEQEVITQSVRSLLAINYPRVEVVVVNDGSKDRTMDELARSFSLRRGNLQPGSELPCKPVRGYYLSVVEPRLLVVDKESGGSKADAINAGINICQSPYFLVVDADSLVEPEALNYSLRAALDDPEKVVAVAGIVRGINGSIVDGGRVRRPSLQMNFWVLMQTIEYIRSFLAGRAGWCQINGLLIVAGAYGLFQKAACVKVGGYNPGTLTEDFDVVVRLHRYSRDHKLGWRVVFAPDSVCWTQMPTTLRVLSHQRKRWHTGLWQTIVNQRSMFLRPRYGVVGMLAMPHQILHEAGGPFIELAGLILLPLFYFLGLLDGRVFVLYLFLAFFIGIVFSLMAILIDQTHFPRHRFPRDAILLLVFSLMEYIGYRQLFLFWRMVGTWRYLVGKTMWTPSARTTFATKA